MDNAMTAAEWFDLVWKLLTGFLALWIFLEKKNDKTNDRVTRLEQQLARELTDQGNRLTRIEVEIDKQLTGDDLGEVYREMRRVSEALGHQATVLSAMDATINSLKEQVGRMDTFWRNKTGGNNGL
jgi:acyl carrier protein phosphodiesterase